MDGGGGSQDRSTVQLRRVFATYYTRLYILNYGRSKKRLVGNFPGSFFSHVYLCFCF
jgi:hypothetical protein